jgi:hypothetical protein
VVRPAGWLRGQLRIQADGLSGHLDEFWPDISESGWIGGNAEGWERGPYWLDGLVPLAYLLEDDRLIAKARRWVDQLLKRQMPDGWLGPVRGADRYRQFDPWPQFVVLKALTQFQEATHDPRVVPAAMRAVRRIGRAMADEPLYDWGKYRWADLVITLHWLHERTGENWLLELGAAAQSQGFDWRAHFDPLMVTERVTPDQRDLTTHVVNNAMGVKQPGVWYRQSRNDQDRAAARCILAALDRYHGQATGVFSGDEHLAGRNPSQGTELCAVVELMYSLEVLTSILGDAWLADRLEQIAFNALPATFKPDMWAHQYDQQVNQAVCRVSEDNIYTSNGPDANIFGLAPNYGCCTANMHQGWPKYTSHLWMKLPDGGGLAAVSYAPCQVSAEIAGANVHVDVTTEYPFADTVHIRVEVDRPVRFRLLLHTPAWAGGATVWVNGSDDTQPVPGSFHTISRLWAGTSQVVLRLPMAARIERRYHGSATIHRGPLVFALRIGEEWRQIGGVTPHGDWEVHPTTPWNYGLLLDDDDPVSSVRFESVGTSDRPFSPGGAPIVGHVSGRRIPGWVVERGAAGRLPRSPVASLEEIEALTLIPYGCTNLRITEFPVLAD